jgi:hypothetical protein
MSETSLPVRGQQPAQRAQLRIVRGGREDAVLRRKQFEEMHPEIVITPPRTPSGRWTAHRDGNALASGYELSALLDTLTRLLGKQP